MTEGALEGIKILDLTHYIAGPYCTKILADFGADVLKVERPGLGDSARQMGPFYQDDPHLEKSGLFLFLNTNKQSITLDLETATGGNIVRKLVEEADVLVENFAPGVMDKLGLGYDVLEKINPRLIMVSISNFGQSGPYRDYKAEDIVEYAMSGLMYVIGNYDREPVKHGGTAAQFTAGEVAAITVLMALNVQQDSGQGDYIDVSIQEAVTAPQYTLLMPYVYSGGVKRRSLKGGGDLTQNNAIATKDGYVVPSITNMEWSLLALSLELTEELDNSKFDTPAARVLNGEELDDIIHKRFLEKTKADLFHETQAFGSSFGIVMSTEDLLNCPQLAEREFFPEVDHPFTGSLKYPGAPFKMPEGGWQKGSAPLLGEHNREIFIDRLGYSQEDLVKFRELGIS